MYHASRYPHPLLVRPLILHVPSIGRIILNSCLPCYPSLNISFLISLESSRPRRQTPKPSRKCYAPSLLLASLGVILSALVAPGCMLHQIIPPLLRPKARPGRESPLADPPGSFQHPSPSLQARPCHSGRSPCTRAPACTQVCAAFRAMLLPAAALASVSPLTR